MINRHYALSSKTLIAQSAAELKRLRRELYCTKQEIASYRLAIEVDLRTLQISPYAGSPGSLRAPTRKTNARAGCGVSCRRR
jgi:hypothetical protein